MPFKILIIEDEKNISEIVAKYLEKEGYTTIIANDGIEGLALFRDSNPDLVISDVMMPTIDGFEVLREIRLISDVPVIMLTAKQEEVDRLKGFENGADDLDFVIDYKAFQNDEIDKVKLQVLEGTKLGLQHHKIVKWIIEVAALNDHQIIQLSVLIKNVVMDHFKESDYEKVFVKSSPKAHSYHTVKIGSYFKKCYNK